MSGRAALALVTALFVTAACGGSKTAVTSARSPSPTVTSPSPSPSPSPSIQVPPIPGGTYEVDVTYNDAVRFGVTKCDPGDIQENTGHIELTLRGGRFRLATSAEHPIGHPLLTGVYTGDQHEVTLIFDPNTADETADTLRWSFDGKALQFKVITVDPGGTSGEHFCTARMVYQAHPWVKTA
jgi:hypothetical protein